MNLGVGYDTLLGMGLGAAGMWYLWNKLEDWSDPPLPPRQDRKLNADELGEYDGREGRLCFVAFDGGIYDVSKDKVMFKGRGGKVLTEIENPESFKQRYLKVGTLIVPRNFTKAQLAAFDGRDGRPVYVCAKGVVYDVDPDFYGPEGAYGIMAGKDATRALALVSLDPEDFENTRIDDLSWGDKQTLEEWVSKFEFKYPVVGYLVDEKTGVAPAAPQAAAFLTRERQQVLLKEKVVLSHDTRLFRFALPESTPRLGLPVGKHIKFWCPNPEPVNPGEWNGREDLEAGKEQVERKYTPSSSDEDLGHFDVVIKVYRGGQIERFPDGGKMSQHLESLSIGDTMDVAGPYGLIEYKGCGVFNIKKKEKRFRMVGMCCGGTGITPMLQLIKAVLKDPKDETKLSLLFANQTEDDILVREMLEEQARLHPERFKLWYTVDRPPKEWNYSTGFIDEDMLKTHMPPPSEETVILMCGPPPMIKYACKANLDKLGYDKDAQVEF